MSAANGNGKPFDLNAARRLRAEVDGPPKKVLFGEEEYTLPAVPPASVMIAFGLMAKGDVTALRDALAGLFGDGNVDLVLKAGFDMRDLEELFSELYGMEPGEQPASGSSSSPTPASSRPTSPGSTA